MRADLEASFRRRAWEEKYSNPHPLWRGPAKPLPGSMKGGRCLELGCGGGKTLRALVASGLEVVGLDVSRKGLLACVAARAARDADLVQGDALLLPFREGSFDLVSAHHVLEHLLLEEREAACREAGRVLRAGGLLSIRAFSREDMRYGKGREVEEATFLREDGILYHYFSPEELQALVEGWELLRLDVLQETKRYAGADHVRSVVEITARLPKG